MIDTNLTGVFHAMRAVLPTMIEQRFGRIVATSSMAGKLGFANVGHYVAAKWGVIGLAKSAAHGGGGARGHGQRDLPDQRGHGHDPELGGVQAVPTGPGEPDAGGRDARASSR